MVLGPLLFLVILEGGLRLTGFGHPMSFFLPMRIDGKECLIENDRFGWRFFGPEMARAPFPFVIPKVKPPDTIRIFVFGESAAYGDPQPEFGLCRVLEALLEGRYPDKHFEVVNTAMTAINSHVILPIARECAGKQGDFWVIYMGNNEVVGPYGSGTVFGAQAASLSMVRVSVALKATRLGQALAEMVRDVQKRPLNQSEWGGMIMFLHNHVRADDPRMATVYASFERNLNDIIDVGLRGGAKVLVSTVARNLKDCGPFASDHRPGLPADELSQWDGFYRSGIRAQEEGRTAEATESFRQAAKVDDTYAEAEFRRGQCSLALGQDAEASRQFALACDQDALRFRADSRINEIIRRAASNREKDGAALVDSEAVLAQQSPHGLTGEEFLYEHVHLNFEGNYLVARALAERVARDLPAGGEHPWPTADDCARRLGWNDFTRRAAEKEILSRLNDPPFKEQANNRQQYQRLLRQIEQLQPATLPDALREDKARTQAAAGAAPNDWILQENLAQLQQQTGDTAGAAQSLGRVARLLPQSPDAWQTLGMALVAAKRDDDAIAAFQQASRLSPESVVSMNSLGELYARENHPEMAAREFQDVLRRKPYWGPAHLGLGKALEAMGKTQEATDQFKEALVNRVNTPESFNTLAKFAFSKGWYGAALTNFSDSLRLFPGDPETQVNLGLTLVKLGRRTEAKAHYLEAVRLQPNFAEAHFCLGLELGADGDAAGAAARFAEAVRLKPELIEAHLNLGIALCNEHLNQQALEQFEEVLRRDSHNQIALKYAQILRAPPSAAP
ncbi:MAG: tetratricopeptide repeat protein [Verrucomicrobiota bacterium]|jgi:tetratricopeptide (TPR) repeat protein